MSKLRESRMEEQVDYNVDKIMNILCKVLISEVTNDIAETKEEATNNTLDAVQL